MYVIIYLFMVNRGEAAHKILEQIDFGHIIKCMHAYVCVFNTLVCEQ